MNHLKFTAHDILSAQWAIITGNPFRIPTMSEILLEEGKEIFWDREYRCSAGKVAGTPLLLASHGIGGASTSILIEELATLGVKHFIRMGTSGSIQDRVKIGDLVLTTSAVRLDGASRHYAPIEYPACADMEMSLGLLHAAQSLNFDIHTGITASSDTFYPGQERYDTFSSYVIRDFQNSLKEWQQLHVLNYEMESATLLTLTHAMGLKSACITGIVAHRNHQEAIDENIAQTVEHRCMQVIKQYLKQYL